MIDSELRRINRDSLFLMADMRVAGQDGEHRVKVRNLSAGGMMGEGAVRVQRGAAVRINIRNLGWVDGSVAWVQESRFGIAFQDDIDPREARASNVHRPAQDERAEYLQRLSRQASKTGTVRKI